MPLLESLVSPETIERLGWMLVHFLWQATAVALLLAVLLRLLRRTDANLRYAVACGGLALMVAMPLITMQLVEVSGPVAQAGPRPEISPPAMVAPTPAPVQIVAELPLPASPLEAADMAPAIPWQERVIASLEPALPYVVLGWLAGVLGLSAWHLGGWAQLQRLRRRMTRRAGPTLLGMLDGLAERLGLHQAVTLLESAIVEVPTVVGWLHPAILLPASALTGLSPNQLRAILAHELAHVRRYDYLANILQTVVEILGFYHPAVWWVSNRIRIERENCCDDLAVRLCGDSLQYARALTSMEEIRHRRSDLAMAASGGSLMARIARLLGRPAVDDRRFTWLPGLIALFLIAGILIPAALVFAAPNAPIAADLADETPPQAPADQETQNPAQILIKFSLFPAVSANKVVDRETRNLLGGVLTTETVQALREIVHADPQQDVTLGELLRTWVADRPMTPETVGILIDVLQSRGYLDGESTPEVLTSNDQQAGIAIGALPPPDSAFSPGTIKPGTFVQVTPHVSPLASDRIRLEITAQWKEQVKPDDPSGTPAVRETEMVSTLTIPNGQCAALVTAKTDEPEDHLHLLLVGPVTIVEPPSATEQAPTEGATTITESRPQDNGQDKAQVRVDFTIARALADAPLDREMMLLIGAALAVDRPQMLDQIAADSELPMTLGAVLTKYVTRQSLSQETEQALVELLRTRGFVKILARPRVGTPDGNQAHVRISSEQRDSDTTTETEVQKVEYGTWVDVTPHVGQGRQITLDMAAKVVDPAPQAQPSDLPAVRTREIATTATLADNRSLWLLVQPGGDRNAPDRDPESLLVMVRPTVVKPASAPTDPPDAQTQPGDEYPRQVLLDVRTISVQSSDLAKSGVEWARPSQAGSYGEISTLAEQGYTPDRVSTDSLLAAVSRLQELNRARIVSSQQILALDGRESRIRAVTEEWFSTHVPAGDSSPPQTKPMQIASGTVLSVTPRVDDKDQITLEIEVQTSKALPFGPGSDLPIITRSMVKNMFTIKDGGTVVLGGLTENAITQGSQSTKEIAIFVTAHLASETGQSPQPGQVTPPIPPADGAEPNEPLAAGASVNRIPSQQMIDIRQAVVNSDPLVRELSESIAATERELMVLQQTLAPTHPTVEQKKALLMAFQDRLQERRTELEQEFDQGVILGLRVNSETGVSSQQPIRPKPSSITTTFAGTDLIDSLTQISRHFGVAVAADLTVKPQPITAELIDASAETAIRQVLKSTPYTFSRVAKADRPVYLVHRPITLKFEGVELQQALQDIAAMSQTPIFADPTVHGKTYAEVEDVLLEKALEVVLTGTPYVFRRAQDHYVVTHGNP